MNKKLKDFKNLITWINLIIKKRVSNDLEVNLEKQNG